MYMYMAFVVKSIYYKKSAESIQDSSQDQDIGQISILKSQQVGLG